MHKNELFFRPSVFGYPVRPPLSLPAPYTPLEVGPLAIPDKKCSPLEGHHHSTTGRLHCSARYWVRVRPK